MKCNLGIDIGGTNIKIGLTDENHGLIYKDSFPTRSKAGSEGIMSDIKEYCRKLNNEYDIKHIGVGCPGDKDDANVSILTAGNLPFRNVPVVAELASIFDCCNIFLENDGNCALIAEWLVGSGKGCNDMVMVTIGTGIGGGCIVNRDVLRGLHNDAGELGHFVINPEGPDCNCGQKGCFEQFASATALIGYVKKSVNENPGSILAEMSKEGIDGSTAFKACRAGCNVAKEILSVYGKHLATGLNGLKYIFAPELIALSGGITKEGDTLMEFVIPHLLDPERVKISSLGGDAGIVGASLLYKFSDYYLSLRKK